MGCSGSKDASETANPAAGGSAAASRESPAVTSAKSQSCEELYSFGKELGSGAYSQVYLCREKKTKEEYAVKKITKANLESYDHDALKDEVNLLRSCDWPHIIKFKEFYDEKEYYYLITEVVAGGELFDRICDKMTYNEAEARDLVATFLKTLQYLHNRKIAHRDLKPENLLLRSKSNDTDVVLADFGFAQPTNGKSLRQVCGTPDYVAPEVIMCNDVDPTKPRDRKTGRPVYANPAYDFQCDIWSAGVIVFILLGGYPPFQAKDENDRDALFELIKRVTPPGLCHSGKKKKALPRSLALCLSASRF
mmetsp:Transcript_10879/g.25483  ORF Transcript_10879/g.25483 Transcript_10879/m.25483 type:complete len:307 (-) Transcript_10879:703-1623(-)